MLNYNTQLFLQEITNNVMFTFSVGDTTHVVYNQGHFTHREPVSITLQALSLVEMAELVQVRFTLCLRDQRSMGVNARCM